MECLLEFPAGAGMTDGVFAGDFSLCCNGSTIAGRNYPGNSPLTYLCSVVWKWRTRLS
jgi:hypothetical protein